MNRLRSGFVRAGVLWTLALLGAAALATVQAIWSLNDAQQACFFHYPAIPCPAADDPAMTQLAWRSSPSRPSGSRGSACSS